MASTQAVSSAYFPDTGDHGLAKIHEIPPDALRALSPSSPLFQARKILTVLRT